MKNGWFLKRTMAEPKIGESNLRGVLRFSLLFFCRGIPFEVTGEVTALLDSVGNR